MAGRIYSVGIYARLSVEGSDRKNESIQTQIEIAKEYMKRQGDMVLYDCYSDLGKTGTNFAREGFERLMGDVRQRRVDCVVVKDFSRFGRNYIEAGNYIQKIFPFLGVRFISVTDGFDSLFAESDDIGINLKNLANEMYARDISLKVKSAKRAKRESGSYVGGIPPYGYGAEWICGKKCLFAEAGTAEVVRWIFAQYDEGRSFREIAESLYERGIHRPAEYRRYNHLCRQSGEMLYRWGRSSIKAVLTNLVYTGCTVLEGSRAENTHEAIISREQFCRIAGQFAERAEKTKEQELHPAFCVKTEKKDIFEGMLFCGCCGRKLGRRGTAKRAAAGQEAVHSRYFCRNSPKKDKHGCDVSTVSGNLLTEIVNVVLRREAAFRDILPEELVQENMKYANERKCQIQKEADALQRRLKNADWAGSEQYRKYREGILKREAFLEWKAQNEEEAGKTRASLEEKRGKLEEVCAEARRRNVMLRELAVFSGKAAADGELIAALIQRIELYPDKRVKITFRFAPEKSTIYLQSDFPGLVAHCPRN